MGPYTKPPSNPTGSIAGRMHRVARPWERFAVWFFLLGPAATAVGFFLLSAALGDRSLHAAYPAVLTVQVIGLFLAAVVLVNRAGAERDQRYSWLAIGYGVAALSGLLLLADVSDATVGRPGLVADAGGALPARADVQCALALWMSLAMTVTTLAALRAPRASRATRTSMGAGLLAATVWLDRGSPGLPALVHADGAWTPTYVTIASLILVLGLAAAVMLARTTGPRPTWPLRWPLLLLVLQCWSVGMATASRAHFDVAWWTSCALGAVSCVVLVAGLLWGLAELTRSLERFTEELAGGLGSEMRRAVDDYDLTSLASPVPSRAGAPGFAGELGTAGNAGRPGTTMMAPPDGLQREALGSHHGVVSPRRSSDASGPSRGPRTVRDLLCNHELEIVLQPVVDLVSGETIGLEALSRFHGSPAMTPTALFGAAADAGIGVELELMAAQQALQMLDLLPADAWLAVNVSPSTATTGELADMLAGSDCSRLVLELTEHVPVEEYDVLVAALGRLREAGARVAVDDAGAGFASFRHVVRLRPDVVKLDMSLTAGIDTDPIRRALVASLLTFARSIGALVIAEGIETRRELDVLTVLGVPYGQGHLLGRPRALPEALIVTLPRDKPLTVTLP